MNVFYLDHDVIRCARDHVDKHVIKMILETAQLLSTAHRVLDGEKKRIQRVSEKTGKLRWKTTYALKDKSLDIKLYDATHVNHPSARWVRQSNSNYHWLSALLVSLCAEYTRRYGKIHQCQQNQLVEVLKKLPQNIPVGDFTQPMQAMPDKYKQEDSVAAYREYYRKDKNHLAKWQGKLKNPEKPDWF